MSHAKRSNIGVYFGPKAWARVDTEAQVPESCGRCGGSLKADGKTYCAACHAIPGGEAMAARDDRSRPEPVEAGRGPGGEGRFGVGDTSGVRIREGIVVPARFARLARA